MTQTSASRSHKQFALALADLRPWWEHFTLALVRLTSEAFMSSFPPMKRWQGFALLLLTIQVPAFAEGIDLQNTRSFQGGPINDETVSQLRVKWVYQTAPDTGTASNAQGSISSTAAVDGPYLYFNDMTGYLTKLNRFTGKLIWRKNYVKDLSVPGFVAKGSRNTPYVKGDLIIVGSNMGLVDRLCRLTPGATPSALGCASGDGAIVLAINKRTGQPGLALSVLLGAGKLGGHGCQYREDSLETTYQHRG